MIRLERTLLLIIVFISGNAILFAQKTELVVQTGHSDIVNCLDFSPDEKYLASISNDSTLKIWEISTGTELRTFNNVDNSSWIDFNGELVCTLSGCWNIGTGEFTARQSPPSVKERRKVCSSDQFMPVPSATFIYNSIAEIKAEGFWTYEITLEGNVNRKLKTLGQVSSFVFSSTGKLLAAGDSNGHILLWNTATGDLLEGFLTMTDSVTSIALSSDGKLLASGSGYQQGATLRDYVRVWDTSANTLRRLIGSRSENGRGIRNIGTIAISPDKKFIATAEQLSAVIWQLDSGKEVFSRKINGEGAFGGNRHHLSFSANGDSLLLAGNNNTTSTPCEGWVSSVGISALKEKQLRLEKGMNVLAVSNDEKRAALAPTGDCISEIAGYIKIVDPKTQNQPTQFVLKNVGGTNSYVTKAVFSPDAKFMVSWEALDDELTDKAELQSIVLWDLTTRKVLRTFKGLEQGAFSSDNKLLAIAGKDYGINLFDIQTGLKKATLSGHSKEVTSLSFTSDNSVLISGSLDTTIKFWNPQTGKRIADLIALGESDWLITTPEGMFDGTPDAWKQLIWRFDNNTFNYAPIEAFFKEFYYPGLLQEIMQGKTPMPPAKDLSQIDIRQPQTKITEINNQPVNSADNLSSNEKTVKVKVEIDDNNSKGRKETFPVSSGANDLRLFRNGSLVKSWKNNVFDLTERNGCKQIPATANNPRKAVCETEVAITAGENNFTAYAFNHENVKSNDAIASIRGADSLKKDGTFYVLAVGVNKYLATSEATGRNYDLNYAVADIESIGTELEKHQNQVKQYAKTEVIKLTDNEATRSNILAALRRFSKDGDKIELPKAFPAQLQKIKPLQPEDAFVIYFAGHGTASRDRFYLIPHDGFPAEKFTDEAERLRHLYTNSVSDEDLEIALETVDAGKMLMIIDACNSGQALEAEEKRRGPMNSRGLAQLAYEKGMLILTASQSQQAALETSRLGHGLLTFALLEGLSKAEKNQQNEIIERKWLDYAVGQVPLLQIEAMKTRNAANQGLTESVKRSEIVFINSDDKNLPPEKRGLQSPRIFYRRDLEINPLVVAK